MSVSCAAVRVSTVSFLALLATGCPGSLDEKPDAGIEQQTPDAGGSLPAGGTVAWPQDCSSPIPSSDEGVGPGRFLVLGEIHGTNEAPAFVARMACEGARWQQYVRVGVELPVAEQARLDAFMASNGEADARTALLASPFWTRPADEQDGRSSEAMVQMLEALRALHPAVPVFAFDTGIPSGGNNQDRDRGMADFIRTTKAAADPDDIFIVHTGNIHARIEVGVPWDATFEPMTYDLLQDHAQLVSLDLGHAGGTAWVCTGMPETCEARPLTGSAPADGDGVELFAQPGTFHGRYLVGTVSASPPAVSP